MMSKLKIFCLLSPFMLACQPCKCDAPELPSKELDAPVVVEKEESPARAVPGRDMIESKYKWNLGKLFADNAAWENAYAELEKNIAEQQKLCKLAATESSKIAANPKKNKTLSADILECLDNYFKLQVDVNKITLYAAMYEDTMADGVAASMMSRGQKLNQAFMELSEVLRNILLLPDAKAWEAMYKNNAQLLAYSPYINNIMRRKDRILNADAERILQLAGDNLWAEIDLNEIPSDAENSFSALIAELKLNKITDENGKSVEMTLGNYPKYRRSLNADVRKQAVDSLLSALAANAKAFAAAYVGQLKTDIFFARARNYPTALEAYLDKDNIPTSVYHNLISAINANLAPLHQYIALRKKILNVDKVRFSDLYIPLITDNAPSKQYSYDEARAVILEALKPLGEDFAAKMSKMTDPAHGNIDLMPHAGKRSGAYCASVIGVDPFILMNFLGGTDDVSTLAHELGHAAHSIYSAESQNAANYRYVPFIAEIASTTNEALLSDYLYKNAGSDKEKIEILVNKIEKIRTTIYRQGLFAEFELAAHEAVEKNVPVDAEWLKNKYAELIAKYYGPSYELGENDGYEWSYVPHFYWKYYVFTYATGLSAAFALARNIMQSPENVEAYLTMLKSGSILPPVELLKNAGVDLNTPKPVEAALSEMKQALDELEKLLPSQPQ